MKPRRLLEPRDATEIFDRAVSERALAVLTLQEGQEWSTFKSRFLERDRNGHFFVLDYDAGSNEALPPLAPGQYVGISFRQRNRKILFATVVEAKGHFVLEDQSSIAAIRYRWPDSMTELQRRAYYRTPVPNEMSLGTRVWVGGAASREVAEQESRIFGGELGDLSCGGALVRSGQAPVDQWGDDELLGVEVQLPDGRPPVILEARYRGTRPDDNGKPGLAVQFIGLELSPDGRLVLQRLAGCVQRLHRLGIASGRPGWRSKPTL